MLYQPKAEGIAGTYKLYHISRKYLRALSEINFYSETVKFSFFDFCFGFAETGFCCKPSASLFGALPQSPPERRPGLDQGSALDPRTRFRKEIFGEISEKGLCPCDPAIPLWKRGLDPLNKCSISDRTAMVGRRLKCSGVGDISCRNSRE